MASTKAITREFWAARERAQALAATRAARFEGDTPAKRLRRKAEAVCMPEAFNRHYLPHYFRDDPPPVHALLHLILAWEGHSVVRIPRGMAKSTTVTFAYPLRQVVCGPVLRAWRDGTLAETDPALFAAMTEVMAEESARRIAAGPLSVRKLGLPEHWDPTADDALDTWLASVHEKQVALGAALPLHWDPFIQIIAVDLDLALEFTSSIRAELERNVRIQSDWGDLTPCKTGDWSRRVRRQASDEDFESNEVRVAAYSMQTEIRGGKHGPWRPSLAIFDDPDGEKTSRTINQRDANEQMIGGAVENGLEPKTGRVIVCGTPHHPDCVVCRLTEKDEHKAFWTAFRFVARDDEGRLLFPARFPASVIADKVKRLQEKAEPELFDRPPALGNRPFKRIHRYDPDAFAHVKLPKVLAFDPSVGKNKSSDYQALVVVRGPTQEPEPRILVHRCEFMRIADPEELVDWLNSVYQVEQPDMALIETIGAFSLYEMLATARGRRAHILPSWVRIDRQVEGKEIRVVGMSPIVNDGTIAFPQDGRCHRLEQQLLQWGDSGVKRDGPDVLQMAVERVRTLGQARVQQHTGRTRGVELERDMLGRGAQRRFSDTPTRFGALARRMDGWAR